MISSNKLRKINRLKNQIDQLQPSGQKWDHDYLEQLKVDFTFTSNHIEGSKLTYGQTLQIIKDFITPQNSSYSEVLDVVNHKAVLDIIFDDYDEQNITEQNIKRLHKELMKNPVQWTDGIYVDPGRYKILDNHTYRSTGKVHNYLSPEETEPAMRKLINETNESLDLLTEKASPEVLSIATKFHYEFLNFIHPFGDGNGRIARIFMNLILLKKNYPPIFIKEIDRNAYLNCFTEEEKAPGIMLDFMADRLIESLESKKRSLTRMDS